jgi:hypothetical protein
MKAVKSVKPATPVTSANPDAAIRVLKTGTCATLSGKSKLTYQIGCLGKADIQFRISANSNPGYFNDDWVSLRDIQEELDKVPSGKPFTSFNLLPLFRGKSMNSPGFLFAALKQEGLVDRSKENQRCYAFGDVKGFTAAVKALNDLTADAKAKPQQVEDKPPKAEVKNKPAAATKKTASKSGAKKKA